MKGLGGVDLGLSCPPQDTKRTHKHMAAMAQTRIGRRLDHNGINVETIAFLLGEELRCHCYIPIIDLRLGSWHPAHY